VSSHDLLDRFRAHVMTAKLFEPPGPALVAVSGGADSMALLFLLHATSKSLGLELVVGHTDHGVHADSTRWAARVSAAADALRLPFRHRALALGPDAGETRARDARYAALRGMQQEAGATYLVTAHHADDQVETVLFRLLRGAGPAGLAGIPARGPVGLRRPLLPFTRAELRAWLAETHQDAGPVEDPANEDDRHDRVWIRRVGLPLLRDRFPDADAALRRTARQAALDRRAWEALLRGEPSLDLAEAGGGVEVERAPFSGYDPVLSTALLRALCRMSGCRVRSGRVGALLAFVNTASSGRVLDLGDGWTAETVFGRVRIAPPSPRGGVSRDAETSAWGGLADAGEARWGDWGITWRAEPAGRLARAAWSTWVRGDGGEVRGLRPGDVMRPLGGVGRRAVRRLLMEARVPRSERLQYPVVVCGDRIVWLPGVCRSDAAIPRPGEPAVRLDVRRIGGA